MNESCLNVEWKTQKKTGGITKVWLRECRKLDVKRILLERNKFEIRGRGKKRERQIAL